MFEGSLFRVLVQTNRIPPRHGLVGKSVIFAGRVSRMLSSMRPLLEAGVEGNTRSPMRFHTFGLVSCAHQRALDLLDKWLSGVAGQIRQTSAGSTSKQQSTTLAYAACTKPHNLAAKFAALCSCLATQICIVRTAGGEIEASLLYYRYYLKWRNGSAAGSSLFCSNNCTTDCCNMRYVGRQRFFPRMRCLSINHDSSEPPAKMKTHVTAVGRGTLQRLILRPQGRVGHLLSRHRLESKHVPRSG